MVKARKPELLLNPPPDGPLRRITATKQVVQIADLSKLQSYLERHPFTVAAVELGRFRTALGVPCLKTVKLSVLLPFFARRFGPLLTNK